jgi:two-component system, sensor histidine kinase and response regulator
MVGDPVRVGQVLVNLVGNAIKFSSQAGKIEVRIVCDGLAGRKTGRGRHAAIAISDQGVGIPADKLATIFRRVFTGGRLHDASLRRHGPGSFTISRTSGGD